MQKPFVTICAWGEGLEWLIPPRDQVMPVTQGSVLLIQTCGFRSHTTATGLVAMVFPMPH